MANKVAKEIYGLSLSRKENGDFTTGDQSFDRLLSLDNGVLYGNPESNAQINAASFLYLSGLFGGKCTGFTAIPFGYLCEVDFDGRKGVHVIAENEATASSSNFMGFNLDVLKAQILAYKTKYELDENEKYFCDFVLRQLQTANENSMPKILQNISSFIKTNEGVFGLFEKNLKSSIDAFNQTNSNNCQENRVVLDQLMYKSHMENINHEVFLNKQLNSDLVNAGIYDHYMLDELLQSDYIPDEDKGKIKGVLKALEENAEEYLLTDDVMKWIICGYLTHKGADRDGEKIEKNRSVIHDRAKDKKSLQRRVLGDDLKKVLNSCATDYTADRICDVMRVYAYSPLRELESDIHIYKISELVETDLKNKKEKEKARDAFRYKYGMTSGLEK